MNKKAQAGSGIWALVGIGVAFVVVGIVLAFGLNIMSDISSDFTGATACGTNSSGGSGGTILYTGCDYDYNGTQEAMTGVSKITDKLPLIGTVVVAVLIIGLLIAGFMGMRR